MVSPWYLHLQGDKRRGYIQHLIHAEVEPDFLDDPFKFFVHLVGDKADTDMCLDAFFGELERKENQTVTN